MNNDKEQVSLTIIDWITLSIISIYECTTVGKQAVIIGFKTLECCKLGFNC